MMKENALTLLIGGARSGKSRLAEQLALSSSNHPVYLATSRAFDEDHAARIARHQADRGPEWETIEEPRNLAQAVSGRRLVVVDCLTLWLTNLWLEFRDMDAALDFARRELDEMLKTEHEWIVVSNEVGQSLHAETELGRKFVDAQGFLNQYFARRAHRVALLVAGIPVWAKGGPS